MKRWTMVAALALLLPFLAQPAQAQVSFGPQLVFWDFEEFGVGARVDFGLGQAFGIEEGPFQNMFGSFNANYIFISNVTPLLFNVNVAVPFDIDAAVRPYAGAGINHYRFSYDDDFFGGGTFTSSGLNLLGGIFFGLGDIPAFGELQYSTTGAGFLTLAGGVMFGGGG